VDVGVWGQKDLYDLSMLWARAFKLAGHLSGSVSRSLILFPSKQGGMQLLSPFTVALKEVSSHLTRCSNYDDVVSKQLDGEIQDALDEMLCSDLSDLQSELVSASDIDMSNTAIQWAHLANLHYTLLIFSAPLHISHRHSDTETQRHRDTLTHTDTYTADMGQDTSKKRDLVVGSSAPSSNTVCALETR